jgi:hypothetical protein
MYLRIKINFNQILYDFEYSFLIFHFHEDPGVKKPLIFGSRLSGLISRGGFFAPLRE